MTRRKSSAAPESPVLNYLGYTWVALFAKGLIREGYDQVMG